MVVVLLLHHLIGFQFPDPEDRNRSQKQEKILSLLFHLRNSKPLVHYLLVPRVRTFRF